MTPFINSPESMEQAIRELGIVPFFSNRIPGYSIQEMTVPGCWFGGDGDPLGPWDWKIECLHCGDIAYGKYLCGGKAAFATVKWYKELMNVRRSSSTPDAQGKAIMDFVNQFGSIGIKEVRGLLGIKKSAADAAVTRLQQQCRLVTGDITRIYRGQFLTYNGWQVSSFCDPADYFMDYSLDCGRSPKESRELIIKHLEEVLPFPASREEILRILK